MRSICKCLIAYLVVATLVLSISFATPSYAATYTKAKMDSIITAKNKSIDKCNDKITKLNKKITKLNKKIKKKKTVAALKKKYKKQIKSIKADIKSVKAEIKTYKAEIAKANVALKTVVSSININLDGDDKLSVGEDYIITYMMSNVSEIYPSAIKWSTSDKSIATISKYDGDITLSVVGSGDATISAVATSSNLVATLDIHVDVPNAYVENILVSSRNVTLHLSEGDYTDNYQIVFADSSLAYDEDLEWTCSDLDVATISWVTDPNDTSKGTYTIHPVSVGDMRISVISDNSEGGTTIDVHVVE